MTHYIADGGLFAGAAADLLALGWGIQYVDRAGAFHGGTWTSASAGEARERRSQGEGSSHAGQVYLPKLQGQRLGQARSECGMRGLQGAHGLIPESHTQRRNAGVGLPTPAFLLPRTSTTSRNSGRSWAAPIPPGPGQAEADILREIMRVSKTGPFADPGLSGLRQNLAALATTSRNAGGFGGQVVLSRTPRTSEVPRIGLQRRRFPPIRPKPGQKAPYRRVCAVEAPGPGGLAPGPGRWCFIVWTWSWTEPDTHRGQVLAGCVDTIKLFCG